MMEAIIKKEFKKKGILRSQDLTLIVGSRTNIKRYVDKKIIYSIGSGFYSDKKLSLFKAKILALNTYYPHAVVIGKAALYLHGLLKKEPTNVDILIENKKSLRNSLFTVHRTSTQNLEDIEQVKFKKVKINTFSPEKIIVMLDKKNKEQFKEICKLININELKLNHDLIQRYEVDYKTKTLDSILNKNPKGTTSLSLPTTIKGRDTKNKLLDVGFDFYCETGFKGITMKMIAHEANVSLATLHKHFKTKMNLKDAIFKRKIDELLNQGYQLDFTGMEKLRPIDITRIICAETLKNIDKRHGEKEHRFQSWCMLEKNPIVKIIIKETCSKAVEVIQGLIRTTKPDLSLEEAEVRATSILLAIDGYNYLKWEYVNGIKVSMSKTKYLKNYKDYIVEKIVEIAFT